MHILLQVYSVVVKHGHFQFQDMGEMLWCGTTVQQKCWWLYWTFLLPAEHFEHWRVITLLQTLDSCVEIMIKVTHKHITKQTHTNTHFLYTLNTKSTAHACSTLEELQLDCVVKVSLLSLSIFLGNSNYMLSRRNRLVHFCKI